MKVLIVKFMLAIIPWSVGVALLFMHDNQQVDKSLSSYSKTPCQNIKRDWFQSRCELKYWQKEYDKCREIPHERLEKECRVTLGDGPAKESLIKSILIISFEMLILLVIALNLVGFFPAEEKYGTGSKAQKLWDMFNGTDANPIMRIIFAIICFVGFYSLDNLFWKFFKTL